MYWILFIDTNSRQNKRINYTWILVCET